MSTQNINNDPVNSALEENNSSLQKGGRSVSRELAMQRLLQAKNYMDDRFLSIGNVREVAAVCYMSEFHFFRSFREAFHITPYQYLLKMRLQLSLDMLKSGKHTISSIATTCGFPDLYTFSKAFKREFGIPPSLALAVDR